uniref:Uncharacterized protein n=1 Tax=Clandestinovirus TaxID=2831644 RepID=A0A8F8PR46_9VIRU|nr:hypothetical protein KOM_12_461 [Clandestinovirus]
MTSTSLNIVLSNAKQFFHLDEIRASGSTKFKVDRYEIRVPPDAYGNEFEHDPVFDYPLRIKLVVPDRPKIDLTFTLRHNRESTGMTDPENENAAIIDLSPRKKTEDKLYYALYENVQNTNSFIINDEFLLSPNIQVVITLVPVAKKWPVCNVH